ncbi:MAG: CHAD domain-containing protein [Rhodothermaceae bacterium]|nr:CHAD domain-containing protein [Rhodothermaceae bacterium]
MEIETKYIAPRSPAFVALMQTPDVAGYHLEPMPAVSVQDVYLDTLDGDLLRQGYVFRVREQDEEVIATLKSLGGAEGAVHRRLELEAALGGPIRQGRLPIIPEGALRRSLDALVGDASLVELVRLRQHRTPRVAFDGARLVGVLTLDVVAHEVDGTLHVTNEVEVELAATGREDDLYRLDPVLQQWGLEPTARSKFERALLRQPPNADRPLLILPDERAALERFQESGTPLHRRRARVVLLASRGLRAPTIANKVGLSAARVRHWIQAYREQRLAIFEGATDRNEAQPSGHAAPRYRVSELVSAGTEVPAVFASDHIPDETFAPEPMDRSEPETVAAPFWLGTALRARGFALPEEPRVVRIREEEIESERTPPAFPFESLPTGGDGMHADGLEADITEPDEQAPTTAPDLFDAPVSVVEEVHGVERPVLAPPPPAAQIRPPRTRPVLQADEPVLHGAARVLRYQYDRFVDTTERLRTEGDATAVRRLLIGAHRVRIALELFHDYLPVRLAGRLHRGLRGTARTLDALGDLDLVRAHVISAQADSEATEQSAFAPTLSALDSQRRAAFDALLARLDSGLHTQWLQRFTRLLGHLDEQVAAGLLVGDNHRDAPDDYLGEDLERPARSRLRHMLGSSLWDRYEALRAYDSLVEADSESSLYPLGVACAAFQYVLGLAAGCSTDGVQAAARPLSEIESHLLHLRHARVTADALAPYMDAAPVSELHRRMQTLANETQAEVPKAWASIDSEAYREALGQIVATI